ncbi:hypothetical protein D3C80_1200980 [compost metagenome]
MAQVLAAQKGQVEQVIEDVLIVFAIEGVLQGLEVRHAVGVVDHHFAVQPGRIEAQVAQRGLLMRQLGSPVMAVAGVQAYVITVDARENPVAVELHLVQPIAGRWRVDQRGQLRLQRIG